MKAILNGEVIAESDDTVVVEGNHYFPSSSLKPGTFIESDHKSFCGWKGHCKYYHAKAGDVVSENAIWYYPEPFDTAAEIRDRVAFWKEVKVVA